jgi:hypothetical protein
MKTAVAILLALSVLLVQPIPSRAQNGGSLPAVAVEAFGCVLCEAGQIAAFRVNIANPDGVPKTVHLLAQLELPSGDIVALIDGPVVLQQRFTQVLLVTHPVTSEDQVGTYWFDAAIFDTEDEFLDAYSLRADKLE